MYAQTTGNLQQTNQNPDYQYIKQQNLFYSPPQTHIFIHPNWDIFSTIRYISDTSDDGTLPYHWHKLKCIPIK